VVGSNLAGTGDEMKSQDENNAQGKKTVDQTSFLSKFDPCMRFIPSLGCALPEPIIR